MRFRKQISICKGVKLNLSGSGVSCTIGGKGLSLNLGKNGVFMNTSLPGTGIYDRKKLIDGKFGGLLGGFLKDKLGGGEPDMRNYQLVIEDNGDIEILTADGLSVGEEEEREIRKTEWYEQQSAELLKQFAQAIEAQTEAFVSLYRNARSVSRAGRIEAAEDVETRLDSWLEELELPMRFDAEYEYDEADGSVMLDVDLPEIEDVPEEKVVELASGAIRAKDKTQKEIKEEYRTCVLGLAVYMASHVFALSEGISDVLVSGYTQRRNKKTGEREDCYVCSIAFERSEFENDDCSVEEPEAFCDRFSSRINVLASGEMKQIEPYTPAEFKELLSR